MFQPRMSLNRSFTSVSIIVQKFFASFNVTGGNEDEVRHAVNGMEFRLTVATLAVIN